MGRPFTVKVEPTTSLSAYIADSMLLEDFRKPRESKTDALKRLFTAYFGEDVRKAKMREIQKKLDRQNLIHGTDNGDQSRIDGIYFKGATIKDNVYTHKEMMEIVIEGRQLTGELKMRNADDSIRRAVRRGDLERIDGGFRIIRKWWIPTEIEQAAKA